MSDMSLGESPYAQAEAVEHIRRAIRDGPQVFTWRSRRCSGELFWSEVALRSFVADAAQRVIASVRDLTGRKLAEDRYQVLSAASFEGIVCSENGVVLDANPQMAAMLGVELSALIGRPVLDFIAPDWRAVVKERIASGDEGTYEHCLLRNDGSTLAVEARARMLNWQGRMVRVTAIRDISERKRVEEELAREKRFAEALFESLPGTAYVFDGAGRFVRWNGNYQRLYGWSDEEMRRISIMDTVSPKDRARAAQVIGEGFATGQCGIEMSVLTHDGKDIPMFCAGRKLELDGNRYVVGVGIEVSDRRQAEQRVLRHQSAIVQLITDPRFPQAPPMDLVRVALERAADALDVDRASIWFLNAEGRLLECADLFEFRAGRHTCGMVLEASKYPRYFEAVMSHRAVDAHDALTDPRTIEFAEGYLRPMGIVSMLDAAIRRHGRTIGVICFEQTRSRRQWAMDEVSFAGQMADQIDRILAESEHRADLRAREERFKRLLRHSNDTIIIVDANGIQTFVSGPVEVISGFSAEELLGTNGFERVHPDDLASARQTFAEVLAQPGTVRRLEYRYQHKDGNWITLETIGTNLLHDPVVKGIVLNNRNVSDRKKAERERTRLQDQLQQAMKMEAVGRLAGGVAHDFNNLLTVIAGNVELARQGLNHSDPLARQLDQVARASESAASLTRQLLAFSRRQIIEPRVLNLNDMVGNLQKMLVRLIGEDVELKTVLDPDLGSVKVDPGQFEQVLVNLAVNARDAMPDGGRLSIETTNVEFDPVYCARHPQLKPGAFVMLAVSDTGHGMSTEVKEHLFEPFFTTKAMGRGTGLGLATTFGAVEQAGGTIGVYSEVGLGTTFKIYLPRVQEQAEKLVRRESTETFLGGNETVLLVEDEESVRDLALMFLKQLGYRALHASNGGEAFMMMEKHAGTIDLLITDVVMPGMNGRELAERLVKLQPGMKVLFTSGYTEDVIVHHGVVEKHLNFIGKPYSLHTLSGKIRAVLSSK
jgi:PAS domain S-box-containing protein